MKYLLLLASHDDSNRSVIIYERISLTLPVDTTKSHGKISLSNLANKLNLQIL